MAEAMVRDERALPHLLQGTASLQLLSLHLSLRPSFFPFALTSVFLAVPRKKTTQAGETPWVGCACF